MDLLSAWQSALASSWTDVWGSFFAFIPNILGAIVVFVVGLIIAYWGKRIVLEVLRFVQLDSLAKSAGIDRYFQKAEIKLSLTELFGTLVEWIVILTFFLAVVDILGLSAVSQVLLSVLGYVPNIIAAILIFASGFIVAKLVDGLVRGALASVDHEVSKPLGKVSRWLIILIAFFAAVDQLKIAQGLVNTFFQGLTYTIVLVVGLSVGLGAKDLISRILTDWYEKVKK
jgi:hypothetical protein